MSLPNDPGAGSINSDEIATSSSTDATPSNAHKPAPARGGYYEDNDEPAPLPVGGPSGSGVGTGYMGPGSTSTDDDWTGGTHRAGSVSSVSRTLPPPPPPMPDQPLVAAASAQASAGGPAIIPSPPIGGPPSSATANTAATVDTDQSDLAVWHWKPSVALMVLGALFIIPALVTRDTVREWFFLSAALIGLAGLCIIGIDLLDFSIVRLILANADRVLLKSVYFGNNFTRGLRLFFFGVIGLVIRRYVLVKAEPTDAAENAKIALSVCWVVGFAWFIRTLLVKLFLNRVDGKAVSQRVEILRADAAIFRAFARPETLKDFEPTLKWSVLMDEAMRAARLQASDRLNLARSFALNVFLARKEEDARNDDEDPNHLYVNELAHVGDAGVRTFARVLKLAPAGGWISFNQCVTFGKDVQERLASLIKTMKAKTNVGVAAEQLFSGLTIALLIPIVATTQFDVDLDAYILPSITLVASLAFVFGSTLQNLWNSFLFIFVVRAFDVEDRVSINSQTLIVSEISWLKTTFFQTTGQQVIYPNSVLYNTPIYQMARSRGYAQSLSIDLSQNVPNDIIKVIAEDFRRWIAERNTIYSELSMWYCLPGSGIVGNPGSGTMSLNFWIDLKDVRWTSPTSYLVYFSKAYFAVRKICQNHGVYFVQPTTPVYLAQNDERANLKGGFTMAVPRSAVAGT